jgi:hypothetical protein
MMYMIKTEVPPTCDPLGPDNKLIVAPGLLSGTSLVNTIRGKDEFINVNMLAPLGTAALVAPVNSMGADHTAGNPVGLYLAQQLDPLKPEGQVETSRFIQTVNAAFDSTFDF